MQEKELNTIYYGSIISLRLQGHEDLYLKGDGFAHNNLVIANINQKKDFLFKQSLFIILPIFSNTQKRKAYSIKKHLIDSKTYQRESEILDLENRIYNEYIDNYSFTKQSNQGELTYGSWIQLMHLNSNKFLAVNDPKSMRDKQQRFQFVKLHGDNTKFTFQNMFRYQEEGSRNVQFNSAIKLCFHKHFDERYPNLYIHPRDIKRLDESTMEVEPITSYEDQTSLEAVKYSHGFSHKDNDIRGGDIIWIRQLDKEVVLSAKSSISSMDPSQRKNKTNKSSEDLKSKTANHLKKLSKIKLPEKIQDVKEESSSKEKPNVSKDQILQEELEVSNAEKPIAESQTAGGSKLKKNTKNLKISLKPIVQEDFDENNENNDHIELEQDEHDEDIELTNLSESHKFECLLTKSMWVIENLSKTDGSKISLDSPFRLLSLTKKKYLCLVESTKRSQKYKLSFEEELTDHSIFEIESFGSKSSKFLSINDFITLKHPKFQVVVKIQEIDDVCSIKLDKVFSGDNVLKISKCQDSENMVAYLEVSSIEMLSKIIETNDLYLRTSDHANALLYIPKIEEVESLIKKLRKFIKNQILFSKFNEKYGELNPGRQKLLSEQGYIEILSIILRDLFDSYDKVILKMSIDKSSYQENTNNQRVENTSMTSFNPDSASEMNYGNSGTERTKMLTTKEPLQNLDVKKKVELLLQSKERLANQIYKLLEELCTGFHDNQIRSFDSLNIMIEHFIYLESCRNFIAFLIYDNPTISNRLLHDINGERLVESLYKAEKTVIDIVLKDESSNLIKDFKAMREEIMRDNQVAHKVSPPILFNLILIIEHKNGEYCYLQHDSSS